MRYTAQIKGAQINVALRIQRTLGTRRAAGYMRNRGFSIEAALYVLARS